MSEALLATLRDGGDIDRPVRAKIDRHLEACERCRERLRSMRELDSFLAGVRWALDRPSGEEAEVEDASRRESPLEDRFSGYELLEEIARGGQGVVYRAMHRLSRRQVAVKLIRLDSVRSRARLEREARLAARLRHPNIVALHDCGQFADGRFGLAMEWVDGVALDAWAEQVRCSTITAPRVRRDRLLGVMLGLCDAVDHAHRNGVIHRDLKPANVLIDRAEQPRVLDFGIALDCHGGERTRMTMTGEIACTVGYAAPELFDDQHVIADTRADVYSLGVILHEMLTGRRPHESEGGLAELVHRVRDRDAGPASALGDGSIPIERDLDTIVAKSIARDPARRYASAASLGEDLRHFLRCEPIEARRDSLGYLARMTLRRHRWAVATAAVVAIAVIGGGAVAAWGWLTARDASIREQAERDRLKAESDRIAGVSDLLRQLIPHGDPTPMDPNSSEAHRLLNAVGDTLETIAFADDPTGTVATRLALAEVSAARGGLRRAEVEYRQALRILGDAGEIDTLRGARVMAQAARLFARRGSVTEAVGLIGEAAPLLRRFLGEADPETIEADIVAAEISLLRGDRAAALAQLDAVQERIAESDLRSRTRATGVRLAALDGSDRALMTRLATELVRDELRLRADGDDRSTEALATLAAWAEGDLAERAGRVAEGFRAGSVVTVDIAVLEDLLAIKRELLGERDRDLVETYSHAARWLTGAARYDASTDLLARAIDLLMPDGVARTVAHADLRMSWFEQAARSAKPAVAMDAAPGIAEDYRRLLAQHGPLHLITRLRELARMCGMFGRDDLARLFNSEALERCRVFSPDGPHYGWTLVEVASSEVEIGDVEAARAHVLEGIERLARADESWSFHRAMARHRLGMVEAAAGNTEASLAALAAALELLRSSSLPTPDVRVIEERTKRMMDRVRRGDRRLGD